ncbi:MAG: polysaccharide export protein [Flavobacterium sp.]|nr:polysaccharide export protein [Flavobacterium sp.]
MLYLQNANSVTTTEIYEPYLQPNDVISIIISSENPEIVAPYNLIDVSLKVDESLGNQNIQTYIIDKNGNIEFPIIGSIKIGGLPKSEAIEKIKTILKDHVKDAVVNLRILNFKVSVLGEVAKPNTYTVNSERITLLEALSLAGDLTIYGNRKTVMLIREKEGNKEIQKIDITKPNFISSPYYYLAQNDVIYVEPNKTRVNSAAIGPNITIGISALSLIVTIIALTTK